MNANDVVHVKLEDIRWPNSFEGPSNLEKDIKLEFLLDKDGNMLDDNDLADILHAYLHDELGECPTSLKFSIGE